LPKDKKALKLIAFNKHDIKEIKYIGGSMGLSLTAFVRMAVKEKIRRINERDFQQ